MREMDLKTPSKCPLVDIRTCHHFLGTQKLWLKNVSELLFDFELLLNFYKFKDFFCRLHSSGNFQLPRTKLRPVEIVQGYDLVMSVIFLSKI